MIPLRFRSAGREGYEAIVGPGSGLRYIREFGVLVLPGGAEYAGATGEGEALLHIIAGVCDVTAGDAVVAGLGGRPTPFAGRPAALRLPPHFSYRVAAQAPGVEIAITSAAAHGAPDCGVAPIRPETLTPRTVGRDNWARTVTMIAPPDFPAQSLILGETLNPPGNWSGVPTHKHDTFRPQQESEHEELYYFRADPPVGWGVERVYVPQGRDELLLLQDRVVTLKPRGYHTVAAAPGFSLYYAFVLAGPHKQLVPVLDPDQAGLAA
jgi:5-deoxy-glucuronate isomerase